MKPAPLSHLTATDPVANAFVHVVAGAFVQQSRESAVPEPGRVSVGSLLDLHLAEHLNSPNLDVWQKTQLGDLVEDLKSRIDALARS